MTIHTLQYGTLITGEVKRVERGGFIRYDTYTPHSGDTRPIIEHCHVADSADDTAPIIRYAPPTIYPYRYNPDKCPSCYFGHNHSEKLHVLRCEQ